MRKCNNFINEKKEGKILKSRVEKSWSEMRNLLLFLSNEMSTYGADLKTNSLDVSVTN